MANVGGRSKVYKRKMHEGVEYLLIHDSKILEEIDLSWVRNDNDIKEILKMLHEYVEVGAKWFWIETDVPVTLIKKQDGFTWLVPDERQNSANYKWLRSKAERSEEKIVARINQYGEGIKAVLDTVKGGSDVTDGGQPD